MSLELKLYNFIQENKESNVLELLKTQYGLQIIEEEDLIIVRYNKKYSKMDEPMVRECRSIVLDKEYNIVCFSPPKSLDINEFQGMIKNWKREVMVQPFLDGTMINCFYYNDRWYTSTRSSVDGKTSYYSKQSFNTLFKQALIYNRIEMDDMDKRYCYSFILNHPDNRIVVANNFPTVTLVYVYRIRGKGKMIDNIPIGDFKYEFKLVNILRNFNSYEDIENYIKELEFNKREDIIQGFFFRYKNYHSKIRHPMYNEIKLLRGNNPDLLFSYLNIEKKRKIKKFLQYYPEYTSEFKNFKNIINYSISDIYKYYHQVFIKKHFNIGDIPKIYRKHCLELHRHFQYKLIPNNFVSKKIIRKYWNYVNLNEKKEILTNNSLAK